MRAKDRIRRADREVVGPSSKSSTGLSIQPVSIRSPFHVNSIRVPPGCSTGFLSTPRKSLSPNSTEVMH